MHTLKSSTQEAFYCLVFQLLDKYYGIEAMLVQEIIRLPEITPIDEAPRFIAGVINLRGHVIPILDLNLRMGRHSADYTLSDAILIIHHNGHQFGMIISEVEEVRKIDATQIDDTPTFGQDSNQNLFLTGAARVNDRIVMLLDPERLILAPEILLPQLENKQSIEAFLPDHDSILSARRNFAPNITPEERKIFQERAQRLQHATQQKQSEGSLAMAVVELHHELLAIDLNLVSGFAQVRHTTPIPCCPNHIVGNMNLRGDILTLLDISQTLEIPTIEKRPPEKTVIIQFDNINAGILINDIRDVVHLHQDDVQHAPAAIAPIKKEYIRGMTPFEDRMLTLLELHKLLTSSALVVNDRV
ncbi:chemotaxis protein CheW [Magnetococcales bacterium HHB-1]